uniref:GIY-YIG nuclease family protein n=1 Tax=Salmonella enterica TaxID=28901 RepID=UPI003523DFF8
MGGHIYLIMMADKVYKIGMTQQTYGLKLDRFKSYPADATLIFVRRYGGKLAELEKMILVEFRKRFVQHTRGYEYFTGNEDEMVNVINNTFMYI